MQTTGWDSSLRQQSAALDIHSHLLQPSLLRVGQQVKLMAAISNGISSAGASPKLYLLTLKTAELWEAALTPEGAAFPIWCNAQVCPFHMRRAHLARCSSGPQGLRAQQQQNSNLHLSYAAQKAQTDKAGGSWGTHDQLDNVVVAGKACAGYLGDGTGPKIISEELTIEGLPST